MLTVEQENALITMNKQGYSTKQIYETLGISKSQAYDCIRRLGLKSVGTKCGLLPHERSRIRELYLEGKTVREIGKLYADKCSEGLINDIVKDIARPNGKQVTINHDYFEVIDTEHKAYWLGFIYADGSVGQDKGKGANGGWTLAIELKYSDSYLLNELATDLQSNLLPREVKCNKNRNGWKSKHNAKIAFSSKKLCQDLIKHGAVPNKTHKLETLPPIPKRLIRHFIRGYFDGDGTIYKDSQNKNQPRIAFYGTHAFADSLQQCLADELGITNKNVTSQKEANVSFISYGVRETKIICEWFYKRSTIFLKRKHDIFIQNVK